MFATIQFQGFLEEGGKFVGLPRICPYCHYWKYAKTDWTGWVQRFHEY